MSWAVVTALISAAVFSTVLSSNPPLSDGSEAVAGIASLGILHAPGYPSYVLVAKAFSLIEPLGDLAFRVSLFSLICASASVGIVQLLARRMGASRVGASVGALALAISAGYWFYAGFTKHDMFSGLCFVVALYLLLSWQSRPSPARLTGLAVAIAVGLGSSWPLEIMLVPGILLVLGRGWRRLAWRSTAVSVLVGAIVLLSTYGFVLVRASENPPLNWGLATTPSALINLVDRSDFSSSDTAAKTGSTGTNGVTSTLARQTDTTHKSRHKSRHWANKVLNYIVMMWREIGPAGLLLAALGAALTLTRRRRTVSWPLLVIFLTNLAGAVLTAGIGAHHTSYNDDLIEEGFLLGCYFILACWLAVGLTDVLEWAARTLRRVPVPAAITTTGLAAVLAVAVLAPRAASAWTVSHRADNDYADRFSATVFSELPHGAAVFVAGGDLTFPLTYRQVVLHERRDVVVVAVGGLEFPWYRKEISRELGQTLPASHGSNLTEFEQALRAVEARRPVYVDDYAANVITGLVGYESVGLIDRVVPGTKVIPTSPAVLEHRLTQAEHAAGIPSRDWNVWPNAYLDQTEYADVGLRAAGLFYQRHDLSGMKAALQNVVAVDPGNVSATQDLSELARSDSGP